MWFLRIFPVIFVLGALGEDLPTLQGNQLLVGSAKHQPADELYQVCAKKGERITSVEFKTTAKANPGQALTEDIFKRVPFTNAVRKEPLEHGGIGRFSFAKVEHKFGMIGPTLSVYALQIDAAGEYGYWLPQGGNIDIPKTPAAGDPKYVFTPDFSGCSWTVTPMNNGKLRLRHVEGGKEVPQFNSKSQEDKGGPVTNAMQYRDYGYIRLNNHLKENGLGYAYMHFSGQSWSLYVQQKTCAPFTGQAFYKSDQTTVEKIKMTYSNKDNYDVISGRKVFRIP